MLNIQEVATRIAAASDILQGLIDDPLTPEERRVAYCISREVVDNIICPADLEHPFTMRGEGWN